LASVDRAVNPVRRYRALAVVCVLAFTAGCATTGGRMSPRDCDTADWRALGLADGLEGAHSSRLDERRQECASATIAPDTTAYAEGYEQGLASFCQPRGGYQHGRDGKEYLWVCTGDTEPAFIQAYQIGFEEYELREAVRDADRDLNRMEREMRNTQNEVQRLQAQYNNSANSGMSERIRLQNEVDALRRRVHELQQDRSRYRTALNQAEMELAEFRKNRPPIPGVD
jgi:chaperonin cofactor prefoldin